MLRATVYSIISCSLSHSLCVCCFRACVIAHIFIHFISFEKTEPAFLLKKNLSIKTATTSAQIKQSTAIKEDERMFSISV